MFRRIRQFINILTLKTDMATEWKQGHFRPVYPEKCINCKTAKAIIYRSSWEQRFLNFCDSNKNVIEWGSEIIEIPYIYDIDKRLHRYKPDVYVKMKKADGSIVDYLVEIKPEKQLLKPKPPKNRTQKAIKNFNYSLSEWIKNQNKWKYARRYCESRRWDFKVLTENQLF